MNHIGLSKNRLSASAGNPREVAFANQWAKENDGSVNGSCSNILEYLIPDATQRDATVAATVMQWLGSNVGMCFLCDVIRSSPEVKRFIVNSLAFDAANPATKGAAE